MVVSAKKNEKKMKMNLAFIVEQMFCNSNSPE